MDDFLYVLRLQLEGYVPEDYIKTQIAAYQDFYAEQSAAGIPPERIMRTLGDPCRVAELIIEDYRKKQSGRKNPMDEPSFFGNGEEDELDTAEKINAKVQNPERGIKAEFSDESGWNVRLGKFKLNSWYGTLIILLIVVGIYTLIRQMI